MSWWPGVWTSPGASRRVRPNRVDCFMSRAPRAFLTRAARAARASDRVDRESTVAGSAAADERSRAARKFGDRRGAGRVDLAAALSGRFVLQGAERSARAV